MDPKLKFYHLIIYCPVDCAPKIREALAAAGAGHIGEYDSCSFSSIGTGRFRGLAESNPTVGKPGELEEVNEERIEAVAPTEKITEIINQVVKVHPYEEPAIHVLPMLDYKNFLKN